MPTPEPCTAYNFNKMPETRPRLSAVFHRPMVIICIDYKELIIFKQQGTGGLENFPFKGGSKNSPQT